MEEETRICDHPDCTEPAGYRAPKTTALDDYYWFCLEHVREYNAAWNYYADMSEEEIERQTRHDTVWQRPTWPMGMWKKNTANPHLKDDFNLFEDMDAAHGSDGKDRPAHTRTAPEAAAMSVMGMEYPVSRADVKARYKELVKIHHPDANQGNKRSEERFKEISEAYQTLMKLLPE